MKFQIKVKPNSKTENVRWEGKAIVVEVKEAPKAGKANRAVIKLLADHFGVPQSQVRIVSGFRGRDKVIEVVENWQSH